jgi:hypothetical protein
MNAALRDSGIELLPGIEARTHSDIIAHRVAFSVMLTAEATLEETYTIALDPERLPADDTERATTLRKYCNWVTQAMLDASDKDTTDGPQRIVYRLHPTVTALISPTALRAATDDWNETHAVPMTMEITEHDMEASS